MIHGSHESRYQVLARTAEQGLPHNWLKGIRQTRDGYIWVTTGGGLVRFDGARFKVFNQSNTPELTSNRFTYSTLFEDSEGALWMGTLNGGAIRYLDGIFTAITTAQGLPNNRVVRIDEDETGTIWIFTESGLFILKEGLTNVAKHAGARHATLSVTTDGASLRCELHDDGRGVDGPTDRGNGLANMDGRAATLGGCLDISSGAQGTTLRLEAQLARPARSKLRGSIAAGRMFMRRVPHAVRGTRGIMAVDGARRSLQPQHPFIGKDQP